MLTRVCRQLRREEDGYALVIAMLLLSIMSVSLVVALNAGNAALRQSELGVRWSRTLTVAETGIDDAILTIAQDRTVAPACPVGGTAACETDDGDYQVSWATAADGSVTVNSVGYHPTLADQDFTREIQVLLEPEPTFVYALFAEDSLEIKNNPIVNGDVYSTTSVIVGNNVVICGSIIAAGGNVTLGLNAQVVTSNVATSCTGQLGNVWANGSIAMGVTSSIAGDATASAPTGTVCNVVSASYAITSGAVQGDATACGQITAAVSGTSSPGTLTSPPAVDALPGYVFDSANYPGMTCYPSTGTCGQTNTSATAVSEFQTYVNANLATLSGTYGVWQENPSTDTTIDFDGFDMGGDLTIITNAPVDFGNTTTVTSTTPGELVVISLYEPPADTSCTTNGGDCSIYGANFMEFDRGVIADPDDGISVFIYTSGKLAFKNKPIAEGAIYAGSMDIKNGFDIVYNSRIARILGFGTSLELTLWQELTV